MQETFLYSVNPRKIITGIEGVGPIRTPKSLYLTKEDVKLCLSKGTVYRRFSLEGRNERVTIAKIDYIIAHISLRKNGKQNSLKLQKLLLL